MKIGVLIDRLNVGGVEKIAIEQVNALRENGEDAYLVILREKAVVEDAFPDLIKKVPIIYLDSRLPSLLRFSFQFPVFHFFSSFHITYPFLIPFVIKKNEFDYFIVHGTYTAFSAVTIKKFRGIPFSAFIWDPIRYILDRVYSKNFLSPFLVVLKTVAGFLDKQIFINTDALLCGGDAHNKYFKEVVPQKKIIVIPPSVHALKKISSAKKDFILMVTAWKRGKNPEYIFRLLEKLPNVTIFMVGKWLEKEYLSEFKDEIKKLGYSKDIKIVGEVTESQLSQYYSQALFVLQTNDDRGFGLPALEAAGHGTTFIIPRGQGVCNLFKDKVDGFYTGEKDTKTIVKYIELLYKDKNKARAMGKAAWDKVVKNYSWEQHGKVLSKIAQTYGKK